ncbi:MAG: glycosyltransferase [Deltaproteobacteria bacterium]
MARLRILGNLLPQRLQRLLARGGPGGVDIIVPVYGAREKTLACLESVFQHARGDWRLLIIDDASPDPELVPALRRRIARQRRVTLHCARENRGFVASANHGMRRAAAARRDVLLLNSDTLVTAEFVARLRGAAHTCPETGIVTPFTNNGTICSVPRFVENNPLPTGISLDEFAALVHEVSPCTRPELVTAVGFCMYIRHEVLAQIGFFDAETFGTGYGEENDFCERAKAVGWRIRLCDDLFIYHSGAASFGDSRTAQQQRHAERIDKLHPHYHRDVQAFIQANPLAAWHARIQDALRARGIHGKD